MVLTAHKKFHTEIFNIPGLLKGKILMFGFQEISPNFTNQHVFKSFKDYLNDIDEIEKVEVLDYADKRADILCDMNKSFGLVNSHLYNRFDTLIDIGCLEHVFNTAQTMKNCIDMVKVGGYYVLHTPVNGYYKHGLHVFNPDMLRWVFLRNGFEIVYDKFSTKGGQQLSEPFGDTLLWLVGKKVKEMDDFVIPIQDRHNPLHKSVHHV